MRLFLADLRLALLLMARSRLLRTTVVLAGLLAASAWLAGQFSPRQPATVALDVGLSLIRLVVPCFGLLQVQELFTREIDRKLILTSLSYPRSRATYLLARYSGVTLLAVGLTIAFAGVLAAVVSLVGRTYDQATEVSLGWPYLVTIAMTTFDVAVILAFGVLLASVATTTHLVLLGGIGFLVIARSASTIILLLQGESQHIQWAEWYKYGLQWALWIVPDLAALDVRTVALYGRMDLLPQAAWAAPGMAAGFILVALALAAIRFERRQFL